MSKSLAHYGIRERIEPTSLFAATMTALALYIDDGLGMEAALERTLRRHVGVARGEVERWLLRAKDPASSPPVSREASRTLWHCSCGEIFGELHWQKGERGERHTRLREVTLPGGEVGAGALDAAWCGACDKYVHESHLNECGRLLALKGITPEMMWSHVMKQMQRRMTLPALPSRVPGEDDA